MKPYFKSPKCTVLIWRQLRIVAYLVIFCPRGILMEIWVIYFSNLLPFTLQNEFSSCLILSCHSSFRGFSISLTNSIPTWPQPRQLPISEKMQEHKTVACLRSETLAVPLETPTSLSPILSQLACQMPSGFLKLSSGGGWPNSPVVSLCLSSTDHMASYCNDMFPVVF